MSTRNQTRLGASGLTLVAIAFVVAVIISRRREFELLNIQPVITLGMEQAIRFLAGVVQLLLFSAEAVGDDGFGTARAEQVTGRNTTVVVAIVLRLRRRGLRGAS